MIYIDVTKAARSTHRSGLQRVSERLRGALAEAVAVEWDARGPGWRDVAQRNNISPGAADWLLTSELFSGEDRPGFREWIIQRACRAAAIFHDAIPLRHPQITWPQSVARHPDYIKMLAGFDLVWAVSAASAWDLTTFWAWQGINRVPDVRVLALGADDPAQPRRSSAGGRSLVCVGIIEPRKNQSLLLEVAPVLWDEGHEFDLYIVGRVNPHFGRPIVQRLQSLRRVYPKLHYEPRADDAQMNILLDEARATVFPTIAEGCGLPLLESLWRGVPCVCSDLPVLRENADAGGCLPLSVNDRAAWVDGLRRVLRDDALIASLRASATARPLPTWSEAAATIRAGLAISR